MVQSNAVDISDPERDLARQVARRFRTQNPDDFESDLVLRIPAIRASAPPDTRNWFAFLHHALIRDAIDMLRVWRRRAQTVELPPTLAASTLDPLDLAALKDALLRATKKIPPRMTRFWLALVEENGHIGRASQKCRIHRNSGSAWVEKIKAVLTNQDFCTTLEHCANDAEPSPLITNEPESAMSVEPLDPFTKVPTALLEWLMKLNISGTKHRLLIWIVRNTYGWHRGSVRFSWCRIALELRMDRGNASRAGKQLIASGAVVVVNKRIAISYPGNERGENPMPNSITISAPANDAKPHHECGETASLFRGAKERCKDMTSKEKRTTRKKKSEPQGGEAGAATPIPGKYSHVDAES